MRGVANGEVELMCIVPRLKGCCRDGIMTLSSKMNSRLAVAKEVSDCVRIACCSVYAARTEE